MAEEGADGTQVCRPADVCGNGLLEGTETCDGDCPSECDDGNDCTVDLFVGAAASCDLVCRHEQLATAACGAEAVCGNGVVEAGELCDGDCVQSCDDGNPCTADSAVGSAASCDLVCVNAPLAGCSTTESCGDGVVDAGEVCDGDCPTGCESDDPCERVDLTGSAGACDARCETERFEGCELVAKQVPSVAQLHEVGGWLFGVERDVRDAFGNRLSGPRVFGVDPADGTVEVVYAVGDPGLELRRAMFVDERLYLLVYAADAGARWYSIVDIDLSTGESTNYELGILPIEDSWGNTRVAAIGGYLYWLSGPSGAFAGTATYNLYAVKLGESEPEVLELGALAVPDVEQEIRLLELLDPQETPPLLSLPHGEAPPYQRSYYMDGVGEQQLLVALATGYQYDDVYYHPIHQRWYGMTGDGIALSVQDEDLQRWVRIFTVVDGSGNLASVSTYFYGIGPDYMLVGENRGGQAALYKVANTPSEPQELGGFFREINRLLDGKERVYGFVGDCDYGLAADCDLVAFSLNDE